MATIVMKLPNIVMMPLDIRNRKSRCRSGRRSIRRWRSRPNKAKKFMEVCTFSIREHDGPRRRRPALVRDRRQAAHARQRNAAGRGIAEIRREAPLLFG